MRISIGITLIAAVCLIAGCGDQSETNVYKADTQAAFNMLERTAELICQDSQERGEREVNVHYIDPFLRHQYQDFADTYDGLATRARPSTLPEHAPEVTEIDQEFCP